MSSLLPCSIHGCCQSPQVKNTPAPPASYPCSRLLHGVSCVIKNIQGQYITLINKTQIHGLAGLIRIVYVNHLYKFEVCVCVCVCGAMKVYEGMVV
jgi:hypothetical protein